MRTKRFPSGWNDKRVRRVLAHYENQTDNEAAKEDAAAFKRRTTVQVPLELVPAIRELIRVYQTHRKAKV
jgi:hypothetical protein